MLGAQLQFSVGGQDLKLCHWFQSIKTKQLVCLAANHLSLDLIDSAYWGRGVQKHSVEGKCGLDPTKCHEYSYSPSSCVSLNTVIYIAYRTRPIRVRCCLMVGERCGPVERHSLSSSDATRLSVWTSLSTQSLPRTAGKRRHRPTN